MTLARSSFTIRALMVSLLALLSFVFQAKAQDGPNISVGDFEPLGPSGYGVSISPTLLFGGAINAIAYSPNAGNPTRIGTPNGVWTWDAASSTWERAVDFGNPTRPNCGQTVGAVVLNDLQPDWIVAGQGEEGSNFLTEGCGVFFTKDGGQSWNGPLFRFSSSSSYSGPPPRRFSAMAWREFPANPTSNGLLYVASDVGLIQTNSLSNFFMRIEGVATDVELAESDIDVVYAAMGKRDGDAAVNGVYKTTDRGATWSRLTGGISTAAWGHIEIGVSGNDANLVYAAVLNATNSGFLGLFESTDGGTTWTQKNATGISCAEDCTKMDLSVGGLGDLFIAIDGDVKKSSDGGANFIAFASDLDGATVAPAAQQTEPLFVGGSIGIYRRTTTSTYTQQNRGLQVFRFNRGGAVSQNVPDFALGGQVDGPLGIGFDRLEVGLGKNQWNNVLSAVSVDSGAAFAQIDPVDPRIQYISLKWGDVQAERLGVFKSTTGRDGPFAPSGTGIDLADRGDRYAPLTMHPTTRTTLFFGTYRVYRSTNSAGSWAPISPDLTAGGSDVLVDIQVSPADPSIIYTLSRDGKIFITKDAGATWTDRSSGLPSGLTDGLALALHPTNARLLYAIFPEAGTDSVLVSTNEAQTWATIANRFPTSAEPLSMLVDPDDPDQFYVGTRLGLFARLRENGRLSYRLIDIVPTVPVVGLAYQKDFDNLYAFTYGAGLYRALTSQNNGELEVSAGSFNSNGELGGTYAPSASTATLKNTGIGAIDYRISFNVGWLTAAKTTGRLITGAEERVQVRLDNAAVNALAPGYYEGEVTFANSTNGQGTVTKTITLSIYPTSPANNNLANAQPLVVPGSTGTLLGATYETGEQAHFVGKRGGKSVWYRFAPPQSGQYLIKTSAFGATVEEFVLSAYVSPGTVRHQTFTQVATAHRRGDNRLYLHASSGKTYYIAVDTFDTATPYPFRITVEKLPDGPNGLLAAVLPYARSVQNGTTATAFATLINNTGDTLNNCSIQMVDQGWGASRFFYRQVDAQNRLISNKIENSPVTTIQNGNSANFIFGITPNASLPNSDARLTFDCANSQPVTPVVGLNTFIATSATTTPPDMLSIASTPQTPGVVNLAGNTGSSFFSVAAVNLGSDATVTVRPDDGGKNLPVSLFVCQTNPTSGACLAAPSPSVSVDVENNETYTFGVFVNGSGNIPFDPANNRLFLRFLQGTSIRGATTVAVRTQ